MKSRFKILLNQLLNVLKTLCEIFENEYTAIMRHNISEYETILQKKNNLFVQFEKIISEIITLTKKSKLSEAIAFFNDEELNQMYLQVQNKIKEKAVLIEKNKVILEHVLQSHQNSYQFWRRLYMENHAGYNQKGIISVKQNISQLSTQI